MSIEKRLQELQATTPEKEKPVKEIKDAGNFPELIEILGKKEKIIGINGKEYSTGELVDGIKLIASSITDDIEKNEKFIENLMRMITHSEGLRDKVSELYEKAKEKSEKEKPVKEIKDVVSFTELFEILRRKNGVKGNSKNFDAGYLEDNIRDLLEKVNSLIREESDENNEILENILIGESYYINIFTKRDGLRDKIVELLKPNIDERKEIILFSSE